MPGPSDTFTSSNRLVMQPAGGNYGLWGVYLNDNMGLIDDLKDGNVIITLSSTQRTLTTNTGAADEARMASISVIGTPAGTSTITAPNVEKLTWVENRITGSFPLVWTNGTGTSVTIPGGASAMVQCDFAGNMRLLGGSVFGGKKLSGIGQGTATDDAVRMDQIGVVSGRTVPVGGTSGQVLVNEGGTATASTSYGWGDGILQGMQTISVPAGAMTSPSTNSASSTTLYMTTSSRPVTAMVFGTGRSDAFVNIEGMPKSWDAGNLIVGIIGFTTGTTGGNVVLDVAGCDIPVLQSVDQPFGTSTPLTQAVGGSALRAFYSTGVTVAMTGAEAQATISLRVRRDGTASADTLDENLFVTGLKVLYTVNAPNDDI